MKTVLSFKALLTVGCLLLASVVGCHDARTEGEPDQIRIDTARDTGLGEDVLDPADVGPVVELPAEGQIGLTVLRAWEAMRFQQVPASADRRFVLVEARLSNGPGNRPLPAFHQYFSLELQSGLLQTASLHSELSELPCSGDLQVLEGNGYTCVLAFEVRFGETPSRLHYAADEERKASDAVQTTPCTVCEGECVDLQISREHCGQCSRGVGAGQICVGGAAQCEGGQLSACGQLCVDLSTNSSHCGQCNAAVPPGMFCSNGEGQCTDVNLTKCDNRCVNLNDDRDHCGGCFQGLAAGAHCVDGVAVGCGEGESICDGDCVDLKTSAEHCGECGISCGDTGFCSGTAFLGVGWNCHHSFIDVSAGLNHTCGILTDQSLLCWGNNDSGQTTTPAGQFRQLSAGSLHTCGLRTTGAIECWGSNTYNQVIAPTGTFTHVTSGSHHSCGIRVDNSVVCWGRNHQGQRDVSPGTYEFVDAGVWNTCVITGGVATCIGEGSNGKNIVPDRAFSEIAVGYQHICGLTTTGEIFCWGRNQFGESSPPAGTFSKLAAGQDHSCAIVADTGAVRCWGKSDAYRTHATPAVHVSAGAFHTCSMRATNGGVVCGGDDTRVSTIVPRP